MKTEWLEAFHVTAETSSLTKASELLHMTQPALSKQIKNLEQAVGAPLFTRTTSGVSLTPAGEIVFKDGQNILEQLDDMQRKIKQLQGQTSFTLGSWPSVAMSYLPQHFAKHPTAGGPELKIKTAHTYIELMAGLEQHQYDAAFSTTGKSTIRIRRRICIRNRFYSISTKPTNDSKVVSMSGLIKSKLRRFCLCRSTAIRRIS